MFSDLFAQIASRFNPNHSEAGCYNTSARVAAISTIDKWIDVARQFLRSLSTCRNALVPIFVLPPEILARVFHFLVLDEPPFTGRQNIGWIRVTHVCRHWRQVALDDSSLWAKIWAIPENPKWVSEMLARAKNAPLDVEFNVFADFSRQGLLMITPHISHTRQLRIHGMSRRFSDNFRGVYSCEAPALEHFELTVDAASPNIFRDPSGNMLFKGHYPRLRTFSISHVVIPWSLIPRGQLTQLKIACPKEIADSLGALNGLVDLLVSCPELEALALDSCLPSQPTEALHGRKIYLPHLSRLRLRGSTSRIVNMLTILDIPSSSTLHLDCIPRITDNDPESLLLSIISAQFQGPSSVEFKSLTVTVAIRGLAASSLKIIASTYPSTLRNPQSQSLEGDTLGNHELVLSFERLSRPGHSTDLLTQACRTLPISNLEFIHVFAENKIDTNWVELFSCCTNVTTMEAIGQGTISFVRALTAPTVTDAESRKKRRQEQDSKSTVVQPASAVAHAAIFPKLKLLGLAGLNLSFPEGEHTSGILFDILARGLQQRMVASGAPAPLALRIWHCELDTEHADDLRELVEDFHWDKGSINVFGRWVYSDHPLEILQLFDEPRRC
jgi:hypothetical protein